MSTSKSPSAAMTVDEKWDHSVENAIRKTSVGFVAGIVPSLVLARSLVARSGIVMLAAGIGAGMAYGEAKYLFDHNITFDRRPLVSVELFAKADEGKK